MRTTNKWNGSNGSLIHESRTILQSLLEWSGLYWGQSARFYFVLRSLCKFSLSNTFSMKKILYIFIDNFLNIFIEFRKHLQIALRLKTIILRSSPIFQFRQNIILANFTIIFDCLVKLSFYSYFEQIGLYYHHIVKLYLLECFVLLNSKHIWLLTEHQKTHIPYCLLTVTEINSQNSHQNSVASIGMCYTNECSQHRAQRVLSTVLLRLS